MAEPIEIVINEETAKEDKISLTLQNTRKLVLPVTGGQGLIYLIIILGSITLAGGIYLNRYRDSNVR